MRRGLSALGLMSIKVRNPKSEIRRKAEGGNSEIRRPKSERRTTPGWAFFGLRNTSSGLTRNCVPPSPDHLTPPLSPTPRRRGRSCSSVSRRIQPLAYRDSGVQGASCFQRIPPVKPVAADVRRLTHFLRGKDQSLLTSAATVHGRRLPRGFFARRSRFTSLITNRFLSDFGFRISDFHPCALFPP